MGTAVVVAAACGVAGKGICRSSSCTNLSIASTISELIVENKTEKQVGLSAAEHLLYRSTLKHLALPETNLALATAMQTGHFCWQSAPNKPSYRIREPLAGVVPTVCGPLLKHAALVGLNRDFEAVRAVSPSAKCRRCADGSICAPMR